MLMIGFGEPGGTPVLTRHEGDYFWRSDRHWLEKLFGRKGRAFRCLEICQKHKFLFHGRNAKHTVAAECHATRKSKRNGARTLRQPTQAEVNGRDNKRELPNAGRAIVGGSPPPGRILKSAAS